MTKSKIEWTDATWPVVTGCAPVSPGCRHCYAARMAATRLKHHPRYEGLAAMQAPGMPRWTGEVRLNHDVLEQPLRWKKPRRVFVASMSDWLHPNVPFSYAALMFAVMSQARQHTYQLLTKRADRLLPFFHWAVGGDGTPLFDWPLPNVWLGVSVENQVTADERIPLLLQTPAAVRFVSLEPLLERVNLGFICLECGQYHSYSELYYTEGDCPTEDCEGGYNQQFEELDWVIVGGESGPGARPMDPQWARDIRDQCQTAGVSFFFKQMSKRGPIPEDLMIREYPNANT